MPRRVRIRVRPEPFEGNWYRYSEPFDCVETDRNERQADHDMRFVTALGGTWNAASIHYGDREFVG
ncbi:hypothetical protein [Nocardia sp. CA-119907]|uniref:hypothetical protein n=1 Tax=Nocardia sp. CA-119907 TaxID=3239973 RepID=UPI003D98FDF9